jgi:hypothetical protein
MSLKKMIPLLMILVMNPGKALIAQTEYDNALWSGALVLTERDKGLDYSAEYQLRLDENASSFSNQFLEFMGYKKASPALLLNGGYRFTNREDHNESRLYLGGFWDITKSVGMQEGMARPFRAVFQVGYQHDFNTRFDDQAMGSNSIRWILVVAKPATETITPYLLGGVLTTWNDAYNFGIDKTRVGAGIAWKFSVRGRLRCQYIYERALYVSPKKHTNILWLRLEMALPNN